MRTTLWLGRRDKVLMSNPLRIAVASRDGKTVSGHIGQCPQWIVFEVTLADSADSPPQVVEQERLTLAKELIFHHFKDDRPHPLQDCKAVIGGSAGKNFKAKMQQRGIEAVMTAEKNPTRAAADYARQCLTPPKPRPVGELICKVRDAFSRSD